MSKAEGPYGSLAQWVLGHRGLVVVITAVVTLLSVIAGLPPNVDSNLINLLPEGDRSVQALHRLQEEESTNLVNLAFKASDPQALDGFLDDLVAELEGLDTVEFAFHEVDPDLAFRFGMMQFTPRDLAELNVRLKGALALGSALNPLVTQQLMDMGPLTERIANAGEANLFQEGADEARILLKPTGSAHDPAFAEPFMEVLEATLDGALSSAPAVELVWIGGAYRHNVEDVKGIKSDLLSTSLGSATLVLFVIVLAFRSVKSTIIVFTPLLIANLINLALVWLTIDSLNTYTSFGTAVLFGLGIDFAVHLVGRYREERGCGHAPEDAVVRAWDRVGPPCMTAALTSAAGFLALAAAEFQGFNQLGVLLASGLLICLVCMLVLLPLLLVWLDARPKVLLGVRRDQEHRSTSTYRLAPTGLMIAVIVTGVLGASTIPHLEFEHDVSALRRDGMAYTELSSEEQALARESYAPVVVSYPDRAALAAGHARIEALVNAGELHYVAKVISVESVLPSDQDARLAQLGILVEQLEHRNLRYLPPPLVTKLLPLRGRTFESLSEVDIPPELLRILGVSSQARPRLLVIPKGNMWDTRESSKLSTEIYGLFENEDVAGEYLAISAMFNLALRDMPIIGMLALVLVLLLTVIDLRNGFWVVGAMGTLVAGMIWAAGVVQMAGIKFNLINIAAIPILLGIGVDVVIHLLHRLAEEGPGGVRRALSTTGVAASISTLTTILSFLSLTLAGSRGVRSVGLLVVFGLIAVFLASAILLPLAWSAGWKVTGRAPADSPPPPAT